MHEITLNVLNKCLLRLDHNSNENRKELWPTGLLAIVESLLPGKNVFFFQAINPQGRSVKTV